MALLTFPWNDVGNPNRFRVIEHFHTTKHQYGGGYHASTPNGTRYQKSMVTGWNNMSPEQWLAFISFLRSVGGPSNPFYLEFPLALYGSPGYGGYGGIEPDDGFDADIDTGYGGAPAFTVNLLEDDVDQDYDYDLDAWKIEVTFREFA